MSHKLLLADDSVTIQRVIELTFADEDVDVLTAGDGEQAIASIQSERPDIVLADVGMPKRSGYDVAAFVKGAPEFSHIPVLLLTGAFEPVDERRAQASGCDGVLVKPFEPQHVIARVRELLDGVTAGSVRAGGPASAGPVAGAARQGGNVTRAVADVPRPAERLTPHRVQPARPDPPSVGDDHVRPPHESVRPSAESDRPTSDLDAYFDRLDAAFAGVTTQPGTSATHPPAPTPQRDGPVMEQDLDWFDAPAARQEAEAPPASPQPAADPLPVTFASPPVSPPWSVVQPPSIEPPDATPARTPQGARPVYAGRDASGSGSLIADAFSALLAAEQGDADAPAVRLPFTGGAPAVTDELVDEITRRVVERLGSHAAHDLVADVVSRVAERLVRDEIDRIRNKHS